MLGFRVSGLGCMFSGVFGFRVGVKWLTGQGFWRESFSTACNPKTEILHDPQLPTILHVCKGAVTS